MRFTVRLPNEKTPAAVISVMSGPKVGTVTRNHPEAAHIDDEVNAGLADTQ
jgi:hypothetical protein